MPDPSGGIVAPHRSTITRFSTLGISMATLLATSFALMPLAANADTAPLAIDAYGGTELAQSVQSGVPVVVASQTTETSQVTAEPNGHFQLVANRGPVRAHTANGWQPIDTTIQVNADGTLSPKVTTSPVSLSGGGNKLLATIGTAQLGINTYWPTTLPTPSVSGSTVTYANVRPNVNLVLTALPSGFDETLVVYTATAAQDLANNPISLSATGKGVTIGQQSDGSIVGTDPNGNQVFGAPAPAAWDSSVNSDAPSVQSSVLDSANALVSALGAISKPVSGGVSMSLGVPSALRSNLNVHYPIYVDPELGDQSTIQWRTVESGGWNYGTGSTEPMRVGYCGWSGCTSVEGNARSYFNFKTTALIGQPTTAKIYSADLAAHEEWNATSAASSVSLTRSAAFGTSTTYPGPVGPTLQTISSSCGSSGMSNDCFIHFTNSNVVAYMQDDADTGWTQTSFSLSAPAENNANYWKKFGSAAGDETLTVDYAFPPSVASVPIIPGSVSCTGQPTYVNDSTPTVESKATSYDPPDMVGFTYQVQPLPSGTLITNTTPVQAKSAYYAPWTAPTVPQGAFEVRAQAQDESPQTANPTSAWSAYANFTLDSLPPAKPTVTSFNYPRDYWGLAASNPGSIKLSSSSDAVGFTYSINSASMPAPACGNGTAGTLSGQLPATNGTATYTPTGLATGHYVLYVDAYDNAHNVIASDPYSFYVAPTVASNQGSNFVEAESLQAPQGASGNQGTSTVANISGASYSSSSASQIVAGQSGDSYTYTISPSISGYYAVGVQLLTGSQNGTLTFSIDNGSGTQPATRDVTVNNHTTSQTISVDTGADPSSPQNPVCATSPSTIFVPLGGFQLVAGGAPQKLTVTVNQGVCGPSALTAGIDDIILAPLNTGDGLSFTASFNNFGIAPTNGSTTPPMANFDGSTADNALSAPALSAADPNFVQGGTSGYTPYAGKDISFKLPQATSNGDNVVATGQTILMTDASGVAAPLQAPANSTFTNPGYLDFLVGSTCGPVTTSAAKEFTLYYSDGKTPTPGLDPVPDWMTDPVPALAPSGLVASAISPSYYLTGPSAKSVTANVHLYVLQIPWDQYEAADRLGGPGSIKKITLPRVGTDFTGTCDGTNNALHVFAFTTSLSSVN